MTATERKRRSDAIRRRHARIVAAHRTSSADRPTGAAGGPVGYYRSTLDGRGRRRWWDADGREVRYADLPAPVRSLCEARRYATATAD